MNMHGQWHRSTRCANGACLEMTWTSSSFCANGSCLEAKWTKSSYCHDGSCLEARCDHEIVSVRDNKLGDGSPILNFDKDAWRRFVAGVKADDFRS